MCWCTPELRTPCCGKINCIPQIPANNIKQLERYGLKWNGPTSFIPTEMSDGYWTPWHLAEELIQQQAAEIEALRGFAQNVMEGWPETGIDGGDLQDIAAKHGLLKLEQRTERCGEGCFCAEETGFEYPAECYRRTPLLTG